MVRILKELERFGVENKAKWEGVRGELAVEREAQLQEGDSDYTD